MLQLDMSSTNMRHKMAFLIGAGVPRHLWTPEVLIASLPRKLGPRLWVLSETGAPPDWQTTQLKPHVLCSGTQRALGHKDTIHKINDTIYLVIK